MDADQSAPASGPNGLWWTGGNPEVSRLIPPWLFRAGGRVTPTLALPPSLWTGDDDSESLPKPEGWEAVADQVAAAFRRSDASPPYGYDVSDDVWTSSCESIELDTPDWVNREPEEATEKPTEPKQIVAVRLAYSTPLRTRLQPVGAGLLRLIEDTSKNTLESLDKPRTGKGRGRGKAFPGSVRDAVSILVTNLVYIRQQHAKGLLLAVPRGKDRHGRYRGTKVPYRAFKDTFDALVASDLIQVTAQGIRPRTDSRTGERIAPGRVTRISPTAKLLGMFETYSLGPDEVRISASKRSLVCLKGKKAKATGNRSKVRWPKAHKRHRDQIDADLKLFNASYRDSFIRPYASDQDLADIARKVAQYKDQDGAPKHVSYGHVELRRAFLDGQLDRGGRAAGAWWQSFPREYRPRIRIATIHGQTPEPTVELDYSCTFPRMLYAIEGVAPDRDDLYKLFPDDRTNTASRSAVKSLVNKMVNNPSRQAAVSAAIKAIRETYAEEVAPLIDPEDVPTHYRDMLPTGCPGIARLADTIERVHAPIAKYLAQSNSPKNFLKLMFHESQIAHRIMLRCWHESGTIVLPIYDSFVVPAEFEDDLRRYMTEEWEAEFGPASPAVISKKAAHSNLSDNVIQIPDSEYGPIVVGQGGSDDIELETYDVWNSWVEAWNRPNQGIDQEACRLVDLARDTVRKTLVH